MINAIFQAVGDSVTAFAQALSSAVSSVTGMFYTTGDNAGLTTLGTLILIAVGVGLVYWAFRLIFRLIKRA